MSEIAYTEFKSKEVSDFLRNMNSRVKDVKGGKRKYATLLSAIVYQDVMDHFKKEEGPDSHWKKWSQKYDEFMQRIGKTGNLILQDSGRLRQTFTPKNFRNVSAGILWFNDAKTSGSFPYAAAHDEGGGKLPQREFMWLSDLAMDKIAEETLQFIAEEGV